MLEQLPTVRRCLDDPPARGGYNETFASADELMALSVERRVEVLWHSGAHPATAELQAVFLSCGSQPGRGFFLAMSVQTGLTPNPRFYKGEGRHDALVWGEAGCPVLLPKRPPSRRPSNRTRERWAQEFYRDHGLFKRLRCGCLEECPGVEWHVAVEAAEERRVHELREELRLREDRRELADELARATLSQRVDFDPQVDAEFGVILARDDEP